MTEFSLPWMDDFHSSPQLGTEISSIKSMPKARKDLHLKCPLPLLPPSPHINGWDKWIGTENSSINQSMPKARNGFHPESSHIIGGDKWIGMEISSINQCPKSRNDFHPESPPPNHINGWDKWIGTKSHPLIDAQSNDFHSRRRRISSPT